MQNNETYIIRQLGSGFESISHVENTVFFTWKQERTAKLLLPHNSGTLTTDYSQTGISTKRPEQPFKSLVYVIFHIYISLYGRRLK